jgi:hypothetical protein
MDLEQHLQTVGDLFRNEPEQWGLRGDPYLWRDLRDQLATVELPANVLKLQHLLETAFWKTTGQSLAFCTEFKVEKYAHGGMSSGGISGEFWRERGFPMIVERFDKMTELRRNTNE